MYTSSSSPHHHHRRSRLVASVASALVLLSATVLPVASAQQTTYIDVPSGAYYEKAAAALQASGALDRNEIRLRPGDLATRAELVKLLVNVNQTPISTTTYPSFDDVPPTMWYAPYMETAAMMGWVKGDRNCYQVSRPCTARPAGLVNRAEAAALLVRTFGLQRFDLAPPFPDSVPSAWYYDNIQIAADNCVLQGDTFTGTVRPGAFMNRAEMIVMFHRATQNMRYGRDCGVPAPRISGVTAESSTQIRVSFTNDIVSQTADDAVRYSVRRVSDGQLVGVRSASVQSSRTVALSLSSELAASTEYVLQVNGLVAQGGISFSDSAQFTSMGVSGRIVVSTPLTALRLRLTFNTDLDAARAKQAGRYTITRVGGTATVPVSFATLINSRTVELELGSSLAANTSYAVEANGLLTADGVSFSDSDTFTFQAQAGHISVLTASSSTRLRVTFNVDLDAARAENKAFYTVSDGNHTLLLSSAMLVNDNRTVELVLAESMRSQRSYMLSVQNLLTTQGVVFSDTASVIFDSGPVTLNATLNGAQQVPPVSTSASGTGTFVLTASGLQYDITVKNLSGGIAAAHFHHGLLGVNGPVLVPISFTGMHASGTWTSISTDDRNALLNGNIYVNVHTALHPDGEIRGQVLQ